MKKVLLTAMTILSVASASVFGMYGNGDSWIDFLAHGNQFRARMDQLGFTLGNGTIKGTFGFKSQTSAVLGNILTATTGNEDKNVDYTKLGATLSAGIGYTSEMIGVGVGYNYTYVDKGVGMHTPVLAINALNNNLRIAIPFQIVSASEVKDSDHFADKKDFLGLRTDIQMRYYTGIDAFNAIRLYVKYGQAGYKDPVRTGEYFNSSLGLELRLYFLNTTVGNASVNPYLKLAYRTALEGNDNNVASTKYQDNSIRDYKGTKPYDFLIMPTLALSANSDVVSLLFEPSIGYTIVGNAGGDQKDPKITHTLAWGAYTELYFTPVKDLEWYFEMNVNNYAAPSEANTVKSPVYFETSTGLTWYLPSLDGSAQ